MSDRKCRTVYSQKGTVPPGRVAMDDVGEKFLAGTALTQ